MKKIYRKDVLISVLVIGVLIFSVFLVYKFGGESEEKVEREQIDAVYVGSISGKGERFFNGSWITLERDYILKPNDRIRTLDGKTTVKLFNFGEVRLSENSEVMFGSVNRENIEVDQFLGTSDVSYRGSGTFVLRNNFSEARPSKGSVFSVGLLNDSSVIYVTYGDVAFSNDEVLVSVSRFKRAIAYESGAIEFLVLSLEEKGVIVDSYEKQIDRVKDERRELIESHSFVLSIAKKKYGITDSDIEEYLERIDSGEIDDRALAEKSPIEIDDIEEGLRLNDKIKRANSDLEEVKSILYE